MTKNAAKTASKTQQHRTAAAEGAEITGDGTGTALPELVEGDVTVREDGEVPKALTHVGDTRIAPDSAV